jgi:CDP-diacylglycerol---glycerol-3-phosphate 3-phosphatidyltransferase
MNPELLLAITLLSGAGLLSACYRLRIRLKGRLRFERIESLGGSRFLGKHAMEAAYWSLQPLARGLIRIGVSADQITWLGFVAGLMAGGSLAFGHFGTAAILIAFSGLLDVLDGMVARMTDSTSQKGEILDTVLDRHVEFFFFGGLALYYRSNALLLALTLLALLGSFMVSYSSALARSAKAELTSPKLHRWRMRRAERLSYLALGAALCPLTIPWLKVGTAPMIFVLTLIAIFGNIFAAQQLRQTVLAPRHTTSNQVTDKNSTQRATQC